jgi:hypothetical protein
MSAVRSSIRSSTSPASAASGGTYPMTCRLARRCTRGSAGGGPTAPGTGSSTPCEPRSATATVAPMRPARASWTPKAWPTPVPPTRPATTPAKLSGAENAMSWLTASVCSWPWLSPRRTSPMSPEATSCSVGPGSPTACCDWCGATPRTKAFQNIATERCHLIRCPPISTVHVVPDGAVVGTERLSHNVQASRQLGMSLITG